VKRGTYRIALALSSATFASSVVRCVCSGVTPTRLLFEMIGKSIRSMLNTDRQRNVDVQTPVVVATLPLPRPPLRRGCARKLCGEVEHEANRAAHPEPDNPHPLK